MLSIYPTGDDESSPECEITVYRADDGVLRVVVESLTPKPVAVHHGVSAYCTSSA